MNTGKKLFLCAGLLAFFLSVSAQSYSLRTNVIGLATTNLNLEASMTLNRKWSLHLPGDLVGQEYGWHFLPTRAALNVVYLF